MGVKEFGRMIMQWDEVHEIWMQKTYQHKQTSTTFAPQNLPTLSKTPIRNHNAVVIIYPNAQCMAYLPIHLGSFFSGLM